VAPNRPYFTHGPERSRVDAQHEFGPHAGSYRRSGFDATSAEAQVANLPRKNETVGRQAADGGVPATAESWAAAAIVGCTHMVLPNFVRGVALGHLYKIVRLGQILERASR
jgi:hypothetical protein